RRGTQARRAPRGRQAASSAGGGGAEPPPAGGPPPRQSPHEPVTVRTALTLIEDGRLYFRGTDAIRLAREHGFEAAVGWLWGLGTTPGVALRSPAGL
ncbi:citrate synthase, partial [Streptomyces tateyamensis]